MKVFAIIVAFVIIGVCMFFLIRWTIQLVKAIKERKNKQSQKGDEKKDNDRL